MLALDPAQARPLGVTLRSICDDDAPYLEALYASTRAAEFVQVPWSDEQKRQFLGEQFRLQHAHYLRHYPGAHLLLIECHLAPAGRVYLHRGQELRLMEITVAPNYRRQGIARLLVQELMAESESSGRPITLHVEADNPAYKWYLRLGFEPLEQRGPYAFLQREPIQRASIVN
jgi:ribosomal protein S18 acetylase RimI-like enzyme